MKGLGSDRLTRFLITSLLTLIFTINFSGISLWFPTQVRSEGSFQFGVSPTTTSNRQGLFEYDSPYSDAGGTTTGIGALRRPIYVDIQSANERINVSACGHEFTDNWSVDIFYVGTQPPSDNNSYNGTYAAYPPASGTQIFTGGINNDGTIGTLANNPNCENNSQLTSGTMTYPVSVLATSGAGVYEIRLRNLDRNNNDVLPLNIFRQFDISITNTANPTLKIPANPDPQIAQGRIWSYVWAFNAGTDPTNGFQVDRSTSQDYYVVVPGGVSGTNFVWQLDLNQFAGFVYELVANNRGVDSPNAALQNVRGLSVPVAGNSVSPQYRMYTSYPDQTFTRPTVGPSISNLQFLDSDGEDNTFTPGFTSGIQQTGTFSFTSSLPGTYEIIIDTNQDGVYGDSAGLDVQLRGDTDAFGNVSAVWNGRNNAGTILPVGSYNAQVKAIVGEYHFIAGDVETSGPGTGLTINEAISPIATSTTAVYWDDKTFLTTGYQPNTGTITLPNGTVGGRHTWGTTSSGGSQGSNGNSWGDVRYLDTFVYGNFTVGIIPAIIADVDELDWGDAPDSYATNKANTGEGVGASHVLSTTVKLGPATTDQDPQPFTVGTTVANGQPSPNANGDDNNGTDDEDGIVSFPNLTVGDASYTVGVTVNNTSAANAYLAGWIDFNRDGQFSASEGAIAATNPIPAGTTGTVNVTWNSLPGISAGDTFARFRINNDPLTTSDFRGGKRNGEVEDYSLSIIGAGTTYDWGDAPDTGSAPSTGTNNYNTISTDNGAAHILNANLKLGANSPDADNGLLQDVTANLDDSTNTGSTDDEDGVTLPNTLTTASTTYSATVNVTNTVGTPATLIGWIDFNKNGVFEANEAHTSSTLPTTYTVNDNTNGINYTLNWTVPVASRPLAQGQTYARLRISNGALTTSTSTAIIGRGEVEDYVVSINPIDLGDAPDTAPGVSTNNYETLIANGGASHTIISTLKIGATTDTDSGLLQNAVADADDTSNTGSVDDEEGVTLGALTTASTTYTATVNVTNTTGSNATLVGWVDFNKNGSFEATEGQTATIPDNAAPQNIVLNWSGITSPTAGDTYARFRLSDGALTTSTPNGAVGNGEVEDYIIPITVPTDYGDAPDLGAGIGPNNYETLSASGGASHTILATLKLGAIVTDADSGTLQNAAADADDSNNTDDEDGITTVPPTSANLPALTTTSTTYSVTVNVLNDTGAARPLVGWIDFNKNGLFEAGEGQSASVPANAALQPVALNWAGISGLTAGNTYARFRISDGALTTATPNGLVGNGEVEDYVVPINAVPSLNVVKRITAVNGTNITGYVAGTPIAGSDATDLRWPGSANFTASPQYLRGAIACTTGTPCNGISGGRPGDTVEYTIYFLSNGTDNLRNVSICDRIPTNTTFEINTYGALQGILLGWDGTATALPDPTNSTLSANKVALTNNTGDLDKGKFFAVGNTLPDPPCGAANNDFGGVVVDVVSGATTVPIATASGVPIPSYGFVRFNVRVNQ